MRRSYPNPFTGLPSFLAFPTPTLSMRQWSASTAGVNDVEHAACRTLPRYTFCHGIRIERCAATIASVSQGITATSPSTMNHSIVLNERQSLDELIKGEYSGSVLLTGYTLTFPYLISVPRVVDPFQV